MIGALARDRARWRRPGAAADDPHRIASERAGRRAGQATREGELNDGRDPTARTATSRSRWCGSPRRRRSPRGVDGPRRREGRRPGRRRRDAPGAQRARHRRHGGDRRGRARRGADALHRREGRLAATAPRSTSRSTRSEGTTITAKGGPNAIACIAMADEGGFLNAPDIYMDKIAVGGGLPPGVDRPRRVARREPEEPGRGQGRRGRATSWC